MKRRKRRGVSLGTITMLTLTCLVLAGFFLLLPRITGNQDLRINATELAVAFDQSIEQLSEAGKAIARNQDAAKSVPDAPILPAVWPGQTAPSTSGTVAVPQPTATPVPIQSFTFCAAGSVELNSAVQKACTDQTGYHFETLLEPIGAQLHADLTIATLKNLSIPTRKLSNSNVPAELLTALQSAGIDALCVGHYGTLDNGIQGLVATKESIRSAGMQPYGAYASQAEKDNPPILQVNGISVALLSYQSGMSSAGKKQTNAEEQAYAISSLQLPVIQSEISAARQKGAQVVVVSLCWGKPGDTSPTDTQMELAQAIADAGADVILGTRSEAVQSVQILSAKRPDGQFHPTLCAYNLGNLFTHNREKRVSLAGVLLRFRVLYDPVKQSVAFDDLAYTPTYCWRGKENGGQRYRVLNSALEPTPEYVSKEQKNIMDKCRTIITEVMEGSAFSLQ